LIESVNQNFGFALPKHCGRQHLRKFRVQKFYPKLRVFLNRTFGFFEPKLRVFQPNFCVFENRSFVFLNQSCSFCKKNVVLPKLRVLIPGFFATETSEYQIYTKFLTKFRLSGNRRNFRSFRWKWITVYCLSCRSNHEIYFSQLNHFAIFKVLIVFLQCSTPLSRKRIILSLRPQKVKSPKTALIGHQKIHVILILSENFSINKKSSDFYRRDHRMGMKVQLLVGSFLVY
jgi:hypothetical protein